MANYQRYVNPETGEIVDAQGNPIQLAGDTLAEQAIVAEQGTIPEGPTPEVPFRFTEQALNPRAEAVSGRTQRDPRARSPHMMQQAQRQDVPMYLYQNELPMMHTKIATGNIEDYRGLKGFRGIADPNSVRGRAAIAGLEGFQGPTQDTMMFDMNLIGQGMGFDEKKINNMLNYSPNRTAMYRGISGRDESFAGQQGLISDAERQKLIDDGITRRMGRGEAENVKFQDNQFQRVYLPPKNTAAFGNRMGDEERFFMGLAQLSGRPGGKTPDMEGDYNWGRQKELDFKLDDPRHMAQAAEIGYRYASGRGYTMRGDTDKSLFYQQRDIDRQFRKAGRVSGSIWENKGQLIQMGVMAAMAAMTGGALGPLMAGALAPTLGVAGATAGSVAGGLGGSLLTGASMGLAGGAMGGLMQSMGSGFEGGIGGTLKNVGMGAGIGGLSGGVLGGLGHAGSVAMGGQGFQGLGRQGISTGMQGGQTAANQMNAARLAADYGINNPALMSGMGMQGAGTFGGQMGAAQMAQPESAWTNYIDRAGDILRSPMSRGLGKGIMGAVEQGQQQEAAMQQALRRAQELQVGRAQSAMQSQAAGLQSNMMLRNDVARLFAENPYYKRETDLGGLQEGVF